MIHLEPQSPVTKTVTVYLGWIDQRILAGFARFAKEKGWALIFDGWSVLFNNAPMRNCSDAAFKVDGIVCLLGPGQGDTARRIRELDIPTVALCNADESLLENYPHVAFDDVAIGQHAAEYFLSLGFENFLVVSKKGTIAFRERVQGFVECVAAKGLQVELACIGDSLSRASLHDPIKAALKRMRKPVAVFVTADEPGVQVILCALNLGLRVPDEVAVLGVDNQELICEHAPVPLSSMTLDYAGLGYEGGRMLEQLMHGQASNGTVKIISHAGVTVRHSTNIVAISDPRVAQAVRFIWENLQQPIGVGEIATHVGLSKSKLGQLFRKHLNRSIVEEITRARIEKAKMLMGLGTRTAREVSAACGFSSPNYFNNTFRRNTGVTPRQFQLDARTGKQNQVGVSRAP
jgi:LacI family transcriptional regulator